MINRDLRNKEKIIQSAVSALAAHPYLCALGICLFLNPFFFGADQNIPNNALWLETFMVAGAAVAFGLYQYRAGKLNKLRLILFDISAILVDLAAAALYAQSRNKAMWHFSGGFIIILILYYCVDADFKKYQTQLNSLMIIGFGFCLKLYYVLVTSVYTRQHDMGLFGAGDFGHAGYIEYLLSNHRLIDADVRAFGQLYHPPLHHAISAVWIYLSENILLTGHGPAWESLQTLTLFYSMCIIISAYRILRHFRLEGSALYIPLIIVSFHPTFIILSGTINNDVLSVALMMGAVVSTLKWYENQTMRGILKIALCVGFGMMTKISVAVAAPPIALVFLAAFIKKIKEGNKLLDQFICFGLVCIPLGMWFGMRNYIKWGVPFTFVPDLGENSGQYLGNQSFLSRVTDFSPYQFSHVYQQGVYKSGAVPGYNIEYNPLVSAMKTSLFGEWRIIGESRVGAGIYADIAPVVLFWVNVAIAGFALAAMIVMCCKKSSARRTEMLFLAGLYTLMMASFYKMAADYPQGCTMDFRYIAPTVIVGAVFIGLFLKERSNQNKLFDRAVVAISGSGALLFAVFSGFVYLACTR